MVKNVFYALISTFTRDNFQFVIEYIGKYDSWKEGILLFNIVQLKGIWDYATFQE